MSLADFHPFNLQIRPRSTTVSFANSTPGASSSLTVGGTYTGGTFYRNTIIQFRQDALNASSRSCQTSCKALDKDLDVEYLAPAS